MIKNVKNIRNIILEETGIKVLDRAIKSLEPILTTEGITECFVDYLHSKEEIEGAYTSWNVHLACYTFPTLVEEALSQLEVK